MLARRLHVPNQSSQTRIAIVRPTDTQTSSCSGTTSARPVATRADPRADGRQNSDAGQQHPIRKECSEENERGCAALRAAAHRGRRECDQQGSRGPPDAPQVLSAA